MNTKTIILCLIAIASILASSFALEAADNKTKVTHITGPELLQKVIDYHDPNGNWGSFKGKIRLVTNHPKSRLISEVIEMDRASDHYEVHRDDRFGTIMGVKSGEPFAVGTLGSDDPVAQSAAIQRTLKRVSMMQQHHAGHIGLPMELKRAGVLAKKDVFKVHFQGRECLAFQLMGAEGKVSHEYWQGPWELYIDPETFALRGALREFEEYPSEYYSVSGEFEINGIKMQRVKNFYYVKDDEYFFTDVYAPAP